MFVQITGTGSYLPERVVTNDELAATLDTSDEWIYSYWHPQPSYRCG